MLFIDPLYGEIDLNIPENIIKAPELQRLREIRLCNINSPFLTGGTSLNRFEHAIGTAFLAQAIIKLHTKDKDEHTAFIIASLLHDIVTAPFGHSLEYLYESIGNKEYEHANIWQMIFTGKTIPSSRNFFIGKKASLQYSLDQKILQEIQTILEQKHVLSNLLVKDIDIDNIDNIFRFAFHIGISFDKSLPLKIASSLKYSGNKLIVPSESIAFLENWFNVRKLLYEYLLENKGDFVAKALLERSFIECFKYDLISEFDWVLTDTQMIEYIMSKGNDIAQRAIQRLMLMDFPKFKKVFYLKEYKKLDNLLAKEKIKIINDAFNDKVFLHFIRDVNKTCRKLTFGVEGKNEVISIGELNDRYLIGLFSDNLTSINKIETFLKKEMNLNIVDIEEREKHEIQTSFL